MRFGIEVKPVLITVVLILIVVSLSVWVLSRTIAIGPAPLPPSVESSELPADSAPTPTPSHTEKVPTAKARVQAATTANATQSAPAGDALQNTESVARTAAPADTTGSDSEPRPTDTHSADLPVPSNVRAETRVDVAASDDLSIYSRSDPDVVPPVALARQPLGRLPSRRDRSDLSRIEVIVNENGTVARVKAHEMPRSLDDAMILTMSLSAAKAWIFEPALKDGRPVKYRDLITVSVR
jgi:hypothetical protein